MKKIVKFTKIVATVNGSTCTPELFKALYENGMDVVRFNTAHMSIEELDNALKMVRSVSDKIGVMVDTKGPNIRTCNLEADVELKIGDKIVMSGSALTPEGGIQVSYAKFATEVEVGQKVIIDDGGMELNIIEKKNGMLTCEALISGVIKNKKSVNVPGADLRLPALTHLDREFIDYSIRNEVEFIAHSFVRDASDVLAVKSIFETAGSEIKLIAKIENRQGVDNLCDIIKVADGIMVARGDLGIEIPLEEVPTIQKNMIHTCMRYGKPVITATQMLQSMEQNPRPTRAEVSDVANAVFDGTDAVMLSGETAEGKYPVESVRMMSKILQETERSPRQYFTKIDELATNVDPNACYLIKAAVQSSKSLPVKAIICNTASGRSARLCSAYRARLPIFAFSYNAMAVRQMALSYGVYAGHNDYNTNMTELSRVSAETLHREHKMNRDDLVVLLSKNSGSVEHNNLCCIDTIGDLLEQ